MGKTRGHGTRKGGASSGRSRGGRGGGRPAKDGAASDFESGSDSDRGAEDKTAKVKKQGELLAFRSAQTRSDSLEIRKSLPMLSYRIQALSGAPAGFVARTGRAWKPTCIMAPMRIASLRYCRIMACVRICKSLLERVFSQRSFESRSATVNLFSARTLGSV